MDRLRKDQRLPHDLGRGLPRGLRFAAALLLGGALISGGSAACGSDGSDASATDVDAGPTFGAELSVTVIGAGRVTTSAGGIDCPGACFARITVADPNVDGALANVALVAESTIGFHFDHWKLDALDLGTRSGGPSQCSPMTRPSRTDVSVSDTLGITSVPFGTTTATPPAGLEAECASYTTVPVAYAITATFAQDPPEPQFDASFPPSPIFTSPDGTLGPALDIGVTNGRLYWRYKTSATTGLSGIASGPVDQSDSAVTVVPPNDVITGFDVDKHVVVQHANLLIELITGGTTARTPLTTAPQSCVALASDSGHAYCRAATTGDLTTRLYSWQASPLTIPSTTLVHILPLGNDLAVDEVEDRLYFSQETDSPLPAATIVSAQRSPSGGFPTLTTLVTGQHSPRSLIAGTSLLFWLDQQSGKTANLDATSASKFPGGGTAPSVGVQGPTVRFIANAPSSDIYFVGLSGPTAGTSSIVQVTPTTGGDSTFVFRDHIASLNGLAVDDQWVYWTQDDGGVYRQPVFGGE